MALFYHSGIFLSIASDDFIVCMFVYLFGSGASVAAVSSARGWHCDSVMALSSARGWHCDSVTAICSRRTAIRSCRGNLPSAHVRRCASVAAVSLARGWRCSSVAAVCSWRASGLVALLWWFPRRASGLVALLWWFPWRAVGDAALLRRFPRRTSGDAALLRRFALGARRCVPVAAVSLARVRRCGSIAAFCLSSRLSFFLCQEKRDGLRYLAFLFRRVEIAIRAFSQRSSVICLGGFTSGLAVYLWRSRRGTEDAGDGERGTGLAARPLCVFAQPHWYCYAFRGEYAGAARPRLRQRVFDSLDSPHAAAGLGWCVYAPSPGYTGRPARL